MDDDESEFKLTALSANTNCSPPGAVNQRLIAGRTLACCRKIGYKEKSSGVGKFLLRPPPLLLLFEQNRHVALFFLAEDAPRGEGLHVRYV